MIHYCKRMKKNCEHSTCVVHIVYSFQRIQHIFILIFWWKKQQQELMIVWTWTHIWPQDFHLLWYSPFSSFAFLLNKWNPNLFHCENWWDTFICNSIFIFRWFMAICIKNHLLNCIVVILVQPLNRFPMNEREWAWLGAALYIGFI